MATTLSLFWMAIPLTVVILAVYLLVKETQLRKERRPFSGKPLRPPGESLRLQLEVLNERVMVRLACTGAVAAMTAILASNSVRISNEPLLYAVLAAGSAGALALLLWTWNTVKTWRDYSLGFDGERAVGEELNRLMPDGCHVFHDLPFERIGNVDHVVVAPHMVFAVETKTWRKRRKRDQDEDHKVFFTGEELQFPFKTDREALEQVGRNAAHLSGFLTRMTAGKVEVRPVLVLPGWFIERKGRGPVTVVNDKPSQLRSAMLDPKAPRMEPAQHTRIVRLLEERSREAKDSPEN